MTHLAEIQRVYTNLSELTGFDPEVYVSFINEMIEARSSAFYTDEKAERYRSIRFSEAENFLAGGSPATILKCSFLSSKLKELKNEKNVLADSYF